MATYDVPGTTLRQLCLDREGYSTFVPAATAGAVWLEAASDEMSLEALSRPRAAQSPKGFLIPPSESVARYGPTAKAATDLAAPPAVVVGVRACELRARAYLDKVLLEGEFEDPAYRQRRESTILVSCDCTDCAETCFCTLVGGKPYAESGYDVNLTPLDDGYLVEVATEAGQRWFADAESLGVKPATDEQLARRDELRQQMVQRLEAQNASVAFEADACRDKLPDDGDERWQRYAADCVECAACTNICPTCHCFYLYDQVLGSDAFERVRTWDSCLLSSYHRMAGGVQMKLTPRPQLRSRLANRVLHKFVYSPQQYEQLGCVGCGRCIDACLGGIDIRQVCQELGR